LAREPFLTCPRMTSFGCPPPPARQPAPPLFTAIYRPIAITATCAAGAIGRGPAAKRGRRLARADMGGFVRFCAALCCLVRHAAGCCGVLRPNAVMLPDARCCAAPPHLRRIYGPSCPPMLRPLSRSVCEGGAMAETENLIDTLALERIEVNLFRGVAPQNQGPRIFGGLVIAQALLAAYRTVETRLCH